MAKKKVLVNQTGIAQFFAPAGQINSLQDQRAAFREREKKGGGNLELFPTGEYVFSSKEMVEFMDIWNGTMVLPKIVSVRGRENKIREAMHDEFFRLNYREGIKRVAASRFCRGHNRQGSGERAWRATADWFLQPKVLPRVLEGVYDDKNSPEITKEDQNFTQETI